MIVYVSHLSDRCDTLALRGRFEDIHQYRAIIITLLKAEYDQVSRHCLPLGFEEQTEYSTPDDANSVNIFMVNVINEIKVK